MHGGRPRVPALGFGQQPVEGGNSGGACWAGQGEPPAAAARRMPVPLAAVAAWHCRTARPLGPCQPRTLKQTALQFRLLRHPTAAVINAFCLIKYITIGSANPPPRHPAPPPAVLTWPPPAA